jgi:GAF domain-containing protein
VTKRRKTIEPTAQPDPNDHDIIASVLHRLSLVDSPPEPGFNRFTRLVCMVADVRMSMVSFVEEKADRQFFKAASGLPEGLNQTSLDRSFCKIVTRTGEMLAVTDARSDDRVKDNPAIEELGVVAYLGAPVRGPGGEPLGSLCAVDRVPRDWTDKQKRALVDLAASVTDHLALRQAGLA